jgi:Uma2 family endonuclease
MADNTRQLRWMVVLFGNLAALYRTRQDVFVAANLFWYPVEGHPEIALAPDTLVVFGRPKGDRGSYRQWEEGQVPVTVAFEVLSPKNTVMEMARKFAFYEDHGVEEYYIYDPDSNLLQAFVRRGDVLVRVRQLDGFASPRLGIRFDLSGPEMVVLYPDGRRFLTFEEVEDARAQAELRATQAVQQAEQARLQAERAEQRLARIVQLSRKARRQQASAEELAELERLEQREPPSS